MMMLGYRLATHLLHCMSPEVARPRSSRECNNFGSYVGVKQTRQRGRCHTRR